VPSAVAEWRDRGTALPFSPPITSPFITPRLFSKVVSCPHASEIQLKTSAILSMSTIRRSDLRIILPLLTVILAGILLYIGHLQMLHQIRLRQRLGGMYEPIPQAYERTRFLSYAMNAPAWAARIWMSPEVLDPETVLSGNAHHGLRSAIPEGNDWWYLLFVGLMWYFIGSRLEQWRSSRTRGSTRQAPRWRDRLLRLTCIAYGLFVLQTALKAYRLPGRFELWFVIAVFAWGAGITASGFLLLVSQWPTRRPINAGR
jgi:hypothetical protein